MFCKFMAVQDIIAKLTTLSAVQNVNLLITVFTILTLFISRLNNIMAAVTKARLQMSVSNKKLWCAATFLLFFLYHFHCARPKLAPQSTRSIPCESKIAAFQPGATHFRERGGGGVKPKQCPKCFGCEGPDAMY